MPVDVKLRVYGNVEVVEFGSLQSFGGSGMVVVSNGARKKRSDAARRPRHDSQSLLQSNLDFPTQVCGDESYEQSQENWDRMVSSDGSRNENKLKKLRLKVGGVTRTIHTKPTIDCSNESGYSVQEKMFLQDEVYDYKPSVPSLDKRKGFGIKFKNLSKPNSSFQTEHVRKSKRVPKRRVLDDEFSEGDSDEDEEIRYLERLKTSKIHGDIEDEDHKMKRERVVFKASKSRGLMDVSNENAGKDYRNNSKSVQEFEDVDYAEEEEDEQQVVEYGYKSSKKKQKKGSHNLYSEGRNESTPTTRSMQSISGSIDLPNLLSSGSKKKKDTLTEVEQQLKKAEAAQRRRMQSEKAAREAEAEAIRRILGQDSGRKKREEKIKKQRDDRRQERAANALTLAAKTVRWVNNPTGTIITFSKDIGLPSIFNPIPCRYPPAREKCAGPNCENTYKYRDSKLNLPLCSLQCYKAINRNVPSVVTC